MASKRREEVHCPAAGGASLVSGGVKGGGSWGEESGSGAPLLKRSFMSPVNNTDATRRRFSRKHGQQEGAHRDVFSRRGL